MSHRVTGISSGPADAEAEGMRPEQTFSRALRTILSIALGGAIACSSPPTDTHSVTKPEALGGPQKPQPPPKLTRTLGIVLYDGFESLDVYGPAEMFGNVPLVLKVMMIAQNKGPVVSAQGTTTVAECGFDDCPPFDLVMVPGGIGTVP